MTKVHKIVLYIVDHDNIGPAEAKTVLEEQSYPNDCIRPRILSIDTRVVEWSDDHPLNQSRSAAATVVDLFSKPQS